MYLDVRADILSGADPFQRITSEVSRLPVSETLLLVNSFEPVPLIRILREKDFNIFVLDIGVDEVHTYITRQKETSGVVDSSPTGEFEKAKARFDEKMVQMDVRALPMPQPMHAILSALHSLEVGRALFVRHKKVPVFLLSELRDRQYSYVYRFVAEGVHLIIYKDENGQDA
ncbi:MAG: DUF2249 domain-containing protein [Chitinophagaceae bacterium]|nr:MAG: DUF2249 domain-containing protein [Chitinophagaceae bacterium]